MPSPTPLGPLAENATETKTMSVGASEQQPMVEVDEEIVASNPLLIVEDPTNELNSRVTTVQPLISLEKEPVATQC